MHEPDHLDLISLGECLVEFTHRADGSFAAGYAGDAFNALFYASRLGLATGFVSAVGDDLFTPMIVEGIAREGIDTSRLARIDGRRNGLYFIELDAAGEYTFHFWRAGSAATQTLRAHDLDALAAYIARARYFLLTGVTLAVMETRRELIDLLERVKGMSKIVFDTNYRARLWDSPAAYREGIEEIIPFVDILLPTEGDLVAVYGDGKLAELCSRFSAMGVETIVVKGGAKGCAHWRDGDAAWSPPREKVSIVDATGAGDAFNAGLLAGLARGLDLDASCEIAQRTARRALGVRGALDHGFRGDALMKM
jgi:2-dehydro-3-deoxygluconokinase